MPSSALTVCPADSCGASRVGYAVNIRQPRVFQEAMPMRCNAENGGTPYAVLAPPGHRSCWACGLTEREAIGV
jgi:hypothetical protein